MQVSSATEPETKLKGKSILFLVLSSFTCWLIFCIFGLDWVIQSVKPLQYIKTKHYVPLEQNRASQQTSRLFRFKQTSAIACPGLLLAHGSDRSIRRRIYRQF